MWLLASTVANAAPVLGPSVERDGVSVRFVDGPEVRDVAADTWSSAVQPAAEGLVLRLSRSEAYRGRRDDGVRTAVSACGRPAERLVIETPELRATPSFVQDGRVVHGPDHVTPATTRVRIELEHRGAPVWVEWSVRTDLRAGYAALEEAFFASITCAP